MAGRCHLWHRQQSVPRPAIADAGAPPSLLCSAYPNVLVLDNEIRDRARTLAGRRGFSQLTVCAWPGGAIGPDNGVIIRRREGRDTSARVVRARVRRLVDDLSRARTLARQIAKDKEQSRAPGWVASISFVEKITRTRAQARVLATRPEPDASRAVAADVERLVASFGISAESDQLAYRCYSLLGRASDRAAAIALALNPQIESASHARDGAA